MRDQEAIQKEVEALKRDGKIMPEDVVAFARDPNTALHECFEWDDTAAAHQYRLEQARQVLRVFVVVEEPETKAEPVRAYVALRSDRKSGGGYRPLREVISDQFLHRQLMRQALADLRAAQNRYARLKELTEVFEAIDRAEERFENEQAASAA